MTVNALHILPENLPSSKNNTKRKQFYVQLMCNKKEVPTIFNDMLVSIICRFQVPFHFCRFFVVLQNNSSQIVILKPSSIFQHWTQVFPNKNTIFLGLNHSRPTHLLSFNHFSVLFWVISRAWGEILIFENTVRNKAY